MRQRCIFARTGLSYEWMCLPARFVPCMFFPSSQDADSVSRKCSPRTPHFPPLKSTSGYYSMIGGCCASVLGTYKCILPGLLLCFVFLLFLSSPFFARDFSAKLLCRHNELPTSLPTVSQLPQMGLNSYTSPAVEQAPANNTSPPTTADLETGEKNPIANAETLSTAPASKWHLSSRDADGDTALMLFSNPDELHEAISPADEERLQRKIDFMILPYLAVCYAFFYIDKTTLSYGAIFGLREDLHLVGTQYNWLSSIFYFGFLAWACRSSVSSVPHLENLARSF